MNRTRVAIALSTIALLAGSAFAQYGSQPQQMPPSPNTSPSQSMPPSQTPPSQTAPNTPPSQNQSQPGQRPSIDDQVQILTQALNLTSDQQAKVKTALENQHTAAMTIAQDPSMQRDEKLQKIHALRQDTITKVRSVLTSDEQKQKFDQMVKAQDDRMHQQDQNQQQQQPPQAPQTPQNPPQL